MAAISQEIPHQPISECIFRFLNRILDERDRREAKADDQSETDALFRDALDMWSSQVAAKINQSGLTRDIYVHIRDKNSEELCALIAKITDKEKFHQVFRAYRNQES